jgi:MFS family permease
MSLAMVLKIFSDCSLCFGILGLIEADFPVPLLIPALLCAISVGIATFCEEKGWPAWRRLCALLPWGCLLLGENGLQMILLSVPAAYSALVILCNKLELEYYTYRRFFLRSLKLLVVAYFLVNAWIFCILAIKETSPAMNAGVLLRYGLVHLLCGVVLQRQLRLGVGAYQEGGKRQMAMMLAVTATIIVGFLVSEPLLRQGLGSLVGMVLTAVAAPFVLVVQLVGWLIDRMPKKSKEGLEWIIERLEEVRQGGVDRLEPNGQKPMPEPLNLDYVAVALIVGLLLVVAVVILFKSFQKRRQQAEPAENVSRVRMPPKKKKPSALTNRGKVRQLYRDFLRTEKNLGMKLRSSDTSADVQARIHKDTDGPSADDLRGVYLAARYDDRQGVSRSQVERAKRALKGTRRTKE